MIFKEKYNIWQIILFTQENQKTKEELDAEVKRKEAQKARQNMVDYAKDKDIHDKIDFCR